MAAAVHPQMGTMGHVSNLQYEAYHGGMSVLEDSDDGHDDMNPHDMEDYYAQHEYHQHMQQQQQQMLVQEAGMDYNHEDVDQQDMDEYSDESSDESVLPDENIDFGLIYALHTFLATVEGQASVVKGDSLLLLDDANSYWWLVRVLKTEDVGYIPAENVETPYERLARLNKHRNIDVAAATELEKQAEPQSRPGKLRSLIGWPMRVQQDGMGENDMEEREGRRVFFGAPTYVEHPGITWSSDEEDEDEDEEQQQQQQAQQHEQAEQNELAYDNEPDDGVEWAQDAVEALRNANGTGIELQDSDMSPDPRLKGEAPEPEREGIESGTGGLAQGIGLGVANIATANQLAAIAGVSPIRETKHLPPPEHTPSPDGSPLSGIARAAPTPPPHRAPQASSETEHPPMDLDPATPPRIGTTQAVTPASSDILPHSASPMQSQLAYRQRPTSAASVGVASLEQASDPDDALADAPDDLTPQLQHSAQMQHQRTPSLTRSSVQSNPSMRSSMTSLASTTTPMASAFSPASSTTARIPSGSVTPASPTSAGPPVFARGHMRSLSEASKASTQQGKKMPLWYQDAFDISRLSSLVRARGLDIRRNTPIPRPRKVQETDEVQRLLYGDRVDLDGLQPDLRAGYVHLQAKLDAFDREVDDLLGALVAVC